MASPTLSVLLVTRDSDVKSVSTTLQAEGLPSRIVSSPRELQRALVAPKGLCVAVLDSDVFGEPGFVIEEVLERLRSTPLLVLLTPDSDSSPLRDPLRNSIEEYASKPVTPSVLVLRVKALILAAGLS